MQFSPTQPDPGSSYSLKFVNGDWIRDLVHVGRAPFGQEDRPGYGRTNVIIQRCPTPAYVPDRECPECGN
jgi:hypothetical protein